VLEWMPDSRSCLQPEIIGPAPLSTVVRRALQMSQITENDMTRLCGRRLALIDDKAVERLQFTKDGSVLATVGTRDQTNGEAICCPLWRWSLSKAGHLRIYEQKRLLGVLWAVPGRICAEWTSVSFCGNTLTVETPCGQRAYAFEA
jgi:hypothetical protein